MNFGAAILHHLKMVPALDEICWVLKLGEKILFAEPLDMNPLGKLVRYCTKKSRTDDEQPLRICDIVEIENVLNPSFFYEEIFPFFLGFFWNVY